MSSIKYLLKLAVGDRGLICCVLLPEVGVALCNYLLQPHLSHFLSASIRASLKHAHRHTTWLRNPLHVLSTVCAWPLCL